MGIIQGTMWVRDYSDFGDHHILILLRGKSSIKPNGANIFGGTTARDS